MRRSSDRPSHSTGGVIGPHQPHWRIRPAATKLLTDTANAEPVGQQNTAGRAKPHEAQFPAYAAGARGLHTLRTVRCNVCQKKYRATKNVRHLATLWVGDSASSDPPTPRPWSVRSDPPCQGFGDAACPSQRYGMTFDITQITRQAIDMTRTSVC